MPVGTTVREVGFGVISRRAEEIPLEEWQISHQRMGGIGRCPHVIGMHRAVESLIAQHALVLAASLFNEGRFVRCRGEAKQAPTGKSMVAQGNDLRRQLIRP